MNPRNNSWSVAIASVALALLLVSGCASGGRWQKDDYHLGYGLPLQSRHDLSEPLQRSQVTDLSDRIFLLSDNQRHELLGRNVRVFRSSKADVQFSTAAIRPPQLDLFGQDLLREALAVSDGFVLHLGDACDISNTGEFGLFAWDMMHARHGWAMAPGNHDGFFFGNSSRTWKSLIQEWDESGETYDIDGHVINSRAMQKDRYVSYYLAALVLEDQAWSAPLARALDPACAATLARWRQTARTFVEFWQHLNELESRIYELSELEDGQQYHGFELPLDATEARGPHVRRLAWAINRDRPWKSFVLQEVCISGADPSAGPPISMLVFDTAQYRVLPGLDNGFFSTILSLPFTFHFTKQVAGTHGNILPDQHAAAREFGAAMKREGRRWIVASHHPYGDLGRVTPPRFDAARSAGGIPVTLSAHSHTGSIRWQHDGDNEGDWLEINVGSLLDSPVEFRDLQVHQVGDRLAVSSHRRLVEDVLAEQGVEIRDVAGHRPSPGDPDYYLNYRDNPTWSSEDANFGVKRMLLAAYLRLFRLFEADHPDQSATCWPTGPGGRPLATHGEVTAAVESLLHQTTREQVDELTRLLYQLRAFDNSRKYTEPVAAKLRTYRLSQALWASTAEQLTRPIKPVALDPDLSFFLLPADDQP